MLQSNSLYMKEYNLKHMHEFLDSPDFSEDVFKDNLNIYVPNITISELIVMSDHKHKH